MKGIVVDKIGGEYRITDDIPKPSPGPNQLLVKPIYGAANPVDEFVRTSGILAESWPWTPCCDIAGTVVEVGSEVTNFKVGDIAFGIQGVGVPGYGGAAEYCLFPADIALKKPNGLPLPAAATVGVGLMTAALGVFNGLDVPLPDPENLPATSDEWVFVLGGGGSVGGYVVQLAKLSGFKVLASVSARSVGLAVSYGADETIDYKTPVEEQVARIKEVTKGGLRRIYDTTAFNINIAKTLLEALKDEPGQKYFATVNDWEQFGTLPAGAKLYSTILGPVGRPDAVELNAHITKFNTVFQPLIDAEKLKPLDYVVVGDTGFESFIEGIKLQNGGAKTKKIVFKLQDE